MMRLEIEKQETGGRKLEAPQNQIGSCPGCCDSGSGSCQTAFVPGCGGKNASEAANLKIELDRMQAELLPRRRKNAKISSDKDKKPIPRERSTNSRTTIAFSRVQVKAKPKEKQDKIEVLFETRSASERTAQKREERLLSRQFYELITTCRTN
jgi:hypothetical protein